jgi:hypothetical protein
MGTDEGLGGHAPLLSLAWGRITLGKTSLDSLSLVLSLSKGRIS